MAQIAPPRTSRAASSPFANGKAPSCAAAKLLSFPVDLHFYFNIIEPKPELDGAWVTETLHMCTFEDTLQQPKRKFLDGDKPLLKFLMNDRFMDAMNAIVKTYQLSDWTEAKQVSAAEMLLVVEWPKADASTDVEFSREIQADDWAGLGQLLFELDIGGGRSPVKAKVEITSHLRIDGSFAVEPASSSSVDNLAARADSLTMESPDAGEGQSIADEFEQFRAIWRARASGKAQNAVSQK